MNTRLTTLLIGMLVVGASLADEPKKSGDAAKNRADNDSNACTWSATIDNWQQLDDRNLIVWAPGKKAYHVQLSFPLFELRSASEIALIDRNADGRICGYGMDEIAVPHAVMQGRSTIMGMTAVDEAGLAKLAETYHVTLGKKKPKPEEQAKQADQQKEKTEAR